MTDLIQQWEGKERSSQQERKYLHFDQKTSIANAKKFITNPVEIARHYFYPFIRNDIKTKRFKKDKIKGERKWEPKERIIMYASHVDSLIYSYYNIWLSSKYEKILSGNNFQSSVLAYRKLRKSNIEFAFEVFQDIKRMGECVVLAFDVSKFFDSLDHSILRKAWEHVLGEKLDKHKDHLNVFNSLTRFAYIQKAELEKEFDIKKQKKELKKQIYRYCSGKEFRERVRKNGLIKTNPETKGIPQGSPISALLSNIYMLGFDEAAYKKIVIDNSGIYRRYCDDILVVCKSEVADEIEGWVMNEIAKKFVLEIQPEKTEKYRLVDVQSNGIFRPINVNNGIRKNVQYLGFEFDGDHIFIRSSSVSRYYRRMKYRVHSAVYDAVKKRGKLFKKKLLLKNTEHGEKIARTDYNELSKTNPGLAKRREFKGNFITYAKRAANKMKEDKILTQIKPHRKKLKEAIDSKLQTISSKRPSSISKKRAP